MLNTLQVGDDLFLQLDLSLEARHLCTIITQSLQTTDVQLLAEWSSTDTSNHCYRKNVTLSRDINIQAKKYCWFQEATDSSQQIASEVQRHFKNCVQLQQQTATEGLDLYPIRGEPQPTSPSQPTSPQSDNNPDMFDLLLDISEPLPQPPPGVTWVNSCVSAREGTSHRLFTLTSSQQPFEVHFQLYNTSDIEGLPERDKPFHTAASACQHLFATSPVLKIIDALLITAAEKIFQTVGLIYS